MLSFGPRGWVMKAVFIVSGLLVLALRARAAPRRGADRGAAMLSALAGIAMPVLIQTGMAGTIATGVAFYLAAMLAWIWLGWIALRYR